MSAHLSLVQPAAPAAAPISGVAPLRNISALSALITKTLQRASHLPGLATFSGPSGFGKSFAAAYAAGQHRAYYVGARSGWTRKAMLLAILRQQGVVPARTVTEMVDQVSEQLALSRRPLIIDEFDHVVARNLVELVRDIYEQSQAAIILIGEEFLPQKLQRWERFHGRVLDWVQAAPWTELEIARSVERVAGGFVLGLTERWAGQPEPRPIRPGLACTVAIDGETLITGWIDTVEQAYDAETHRLVVRGRDRTGDLFDCAALHRPFEILGLTLDGIATRLCAPFNIPVRAVVDVGRPFARFAIQPGETVWDAIERGCRQRAVLPMPDGRGGLLLTRAGEGGAAAAPLRLGGPDGNILAGRMELSARELFSEYLVMGQAAASDWSSVFLPGGVQAERPPMSPSARLRDPSVTRHRPTIVLAEMQGSGVTLAQRAEWQRAVALGRAVRGTYTVQDWRAAGALWQPNTLVRVTDSLLRLDGAEMLIAATTMRLTEGGTTTEIEVAPRDAYRLIPEGIDGIEGGTASALHPFSPWANQPRR